MKKENIDLILENQSLKNEFAIRNLDLDQVFCATPEDLELENRRLNHLLDWVNKYNECGSRKDMEADGYLFPPIEPDFSPDNDWYLFERWMHGKPTRLKLSEQLGRPYIPKDADYLTDEVAKAELEFLSETLSEVGFCADFKEDIPPRLVYEHLVDLLYEEFDLIAEGCWHLDGCSGYCPGCFQRPWCEFGTKSCWREDEQAGEMFLIDSVRKYVSPSPVSLAILRQCQKEEDEEFAAWKRSNKEGDGILPYSASFDSDGEDDLSF